MSRVEKAFLRAVEDLNAGRTEPVERYLELVAQSEQEQLADLLAMFFASRPPAAETVSLGSPSYQRALAALDAVTENAGKTGVLPGTLVSLRRLRGLRSTEITDELARRFELGEAARQRLEWSYHRLEAGQLAGRQLSKRLLAALAEIFGAEADDFVAASEPVAGGATGGAQPVLARSAGRPARQPSSARQAAAAPASRDPDIEAVERLFTGGRDA